MPQYQQKIARVSEVEWTDRVVPCAFAVPEESSDFVQRAEQEQREGKKERKRRIVPLGPIPAVNSTALLGPAPKIMQKQPNAASSEAERQRGSIDL